MPCPSPSEPSATWEHYRLYRRVIDALYAVPAHFDSRTMIEGIAATDLQTLNSVLGAAIEEQVVSTLNRMRPVWDPDNEYQRFFFQRQAQVFPDVLLKSDLNGQEIILGIELKGWYLLAKERVPNFRFTTTADACAEADLIVVMPWNLSNVLSGTPVTHKPFVAQAKYAAEYRNYWWTEVRSTESDTNIISPADVEPYPSTGTQVADRPVSDGGNNFGRLARTGLLDEYIEQMLDFRLSGIPAGEWINFLRRFEQ